MSLRSTYILTKLAVIKDYGELIRAAKRQHGQQKFSTFSTCKAQGNQDKMRIAFFEREKKF